MQRTLQLSVRDTTDADVTAVHLRSETNVSDEHVTQTPVTELFQMADAPGQLMTLTLDKRPVAIIDISGRIAGDLESFREQVMWLKRGYRLDTIYPVFAGLSELIQLESSFSAS